MFVSLVTMSTNTPGKVERPREDSAHERAFPGEWTYVMDQLATIYRTMFPSIWSHIQTKSKVYMVASNTSCTTPRPVSQASVAACVLCVHARVLEIVPGYGIDHRHCHLKKWCTRGQICSHYGHRVYKLKANSRVATNSKQAFNRFGVLLDGGDQWFGPAIAHLRGTHNVVLCVMCTNLPLLSSYLAFIKFCGTFPPLTSQWLSIKANTSPTKWKRDWANQSAPHFSSRDHSLCSPGHLWRLLSPHSWPQSNPRASQGVLSSP